MFRFVFQKSFFILTRANRIRQERPKIKLILAPPPSIPEIVSTELGCLHGESRIRDFQRRKVVPGMENWKKFLRAKRPTALIKNLNAKSQCKTKKMENSFGENDQMSPDFGDFLSQTKKEKIGKNG